jgi:2-polyprenyl-3-methyl-5-hydroxy-6-metoxy-1,4-benzoquinol methylase
MNGMSHSKKVGNVTLTYIGNQQSEAYSEGDVENDLLELFRSPSSEKKRASILANQPSWSLRYHLSPYRGNLVRWYDFARGSSVLEVGAGCGAITEELVKKDVHVTALELTERRSLINAHRNKNSENLEIIIGNLENYSSAKKFDYVVCVGVLEYAGSFTSGINPYSDFLKMMRNRLNKNGRLLLAIENRLGLKYWAGAREDHTSNYFDGINSYPDKKRVQTFGRVELEKLILSAGFESTDFYYPFPDYKLPRVIYSDDYMPGVHCQFPLQLLPVAAPDQTRQHLFSEQSAMINIESNRLFSSLSNSFLVVAS